MRWEVAARRRDRRTSQSSDNVYELIRHPRRRDDLTALKLVRDMTTMMQEYVR